MKNTTLKVLSLSLIASVGLFASACSDDDGDNNGKTNGSKSTNTSTATSTAGTSTSTSVDTSTSGTSSSTSSTGGTGTSTGTGTGTTGGDDPFVFRTEAVDAATYVRVDRSGMPAVSTVLAGTLTGADDDEKNAIKNAYNDGNPSDDAMLAFAEIAIKNLEALHGALDDDLTGLGFVPCNSTDYDLAQGQLPPCVSQQVIPGVSVGNLVIPDVIGIDPMQPAGFPNGRLLADPVIDVTLSIILLDLTAMTTGATPVAQTPASLVGALNPKENDKPFLDVFPYLAAPHTK